VSNALGWCPTSPLPPPTKLQPPVAAPIQDRLRLHPVHLEILFILFRQWRLSCSEQDLGGLQDRQDILTLLVAKVGFRQEFVLRDYLGNARVHFSDLNGDGALQPFACNPAVPCVPLGNGGGYTEMLQVQHYYPFGMEFDGPWEMPLDPDEINHYTYNGKELNRDFGLGWLDYGARWYMPEIGRWNAVDPLAELASDWTPYRYGFNNPINNVDPLGLFEEKVTGKNGKKQVKGDEVERSINGREIRIGYSESLIGSSGSSYYFYSSGSAVSGGVNVSPKSSFVNTPNTPRAVFSQYTPGQQFNGGPPWDYNGQTYHSKSDLYLGVLVDKTAEQFGIKDLIALTAALDNMGSLPKMGGTKGSSKTTSYASKYGSKLLPQKIPRVPTHVRNGKVMCTKVLGRFLGRIAGPVGWAILAYDIGATLYKTQTTYNNIINGK
jgi:RHS repeat-associated protein